MSDLAKLGHVRPGTHMVMLYHVKSRLYLLGKFKAGEVRLGHVKSG